MSARRLYFNHDIPELARDAFERMEEPTTPEQELFQEVVARAVLDACGLTGLPNKEHRNTVIREARIWLKFGDNTEELFEIAGLELKPIKQSVLAVKAQYTDTEKE